MGGEVDGPSGAALAGGEAGKDRHNSIAFLYRSLAERGWLAPLAFSNYEIVLMETDGVDPDQGDRIVGRELDHGIPRAIVADRGLQGGPIVKVSLHVDDIMLRRRAADSCIALVEIVDHVVAGADVEHEGVAIRPTPELIITGPAVQRVGAAGDRARGGRGIARGVAVEPIAAIPTIEGVIPALGTAGHGADIAHEGSKPGTGDRESVIPALGSAGHLIGVAEKERRRPGIGQRKGVIPALGTVRHELGITEEVSLRVDAGIVGREGVIPALGTAGHVIGVAGEESRGVVTGIGRRECVIPALAGASYDIGVAVERRRRAVPGIVGREGRRRPHH
jgi:hypothetical protein